MATIYRFIVEQRTGGGGDGRYVSDGAPNRKSAAKKGIIRHLPEDNKTKRNPILSGSFSAISVFIRISLF